MRTKSRTISVASVLIVSATIGCSRYQPYGQPGYYGYGQPVYTAPGGSYVQPGTLTPVPPAGGGTFVAPNDPQARNIGIGDAPTFDPATDVDPRKDENLVPEYNDPGDLGSGAGDGGFGADDGFDNPRFEDDSGFDDFDSGSGSGGGGFDDFDSGSGGGFDDDGFGDGAFDETSSRLPLPYADPADGQLRASDSFDDGDFEQPVSIDTRTLQPTSVELRKAPVEQTSARRTTVRPNPYDHDAEGFRWIRGVIDHDERTDSWNVIYSLRPGRDDEFGGSLTVVGDETAFETLESGAVVLARGQVDRSTRDDLGKPVYRFEKLAELVARD